MAFTDEEQMVWDELNKRDLLDLQNATYLIEFCRNVYQRDYSERKPLIDICNKIKNKCMQMVLEATQKELTIEEQEHIYEVNDIFWAIIKMEAQNLQFDSYCLYLEKNRDPKEKFYQPRRNCLRRLGIPQAFQRLIDDELDVLTISLPPGSGKTSLEKFFHSAVAGWYPMDFSLFYSHSGDITRMYYDGVYDIVTNSDEYTWGEIFPGLHVTNTNAKLEQFNIGKYKPFPSVQCTSVGAKNAGKVRASRYLFVDDMIGSIEEAMNKNTLEKLWNAYSVDARQRKVTSPFDGKFCKELHLATRWSTLDVIGRLQQRYEGNDRAEFIAIPDIDPRTGRSNFEYDIGGYSVENFHDIEMLMDDISYRCLYKQDPIEREGLLYQDDELRRFVDLPNREPDAVLGICDTKEKGIDYMFLPIFYKYDNDYFLVDCICDDNSDFGTQYGRLTDIILRHNVQQVEFESNQGGSRIAFEVQKRVKDQGGMCNITTKPTETNKETRIIVNSDWVKQNCLFLEKTEYTPKSDYGRMMGFLLGYSVAGKNKHDDVPDGMANFALFVSRKLNVKQTRIIQSPF